MIFKIIMFLLSLCITYNKESNYIVHSSNRLNYVVNDKDNYVSEPVTLTAYTPYCDGCIGITASGHDVRNDVYYNDNEYGLIRVVAADKKYEFGSIVLFENIEGYDDFIGIVLDRGSAIGINKKSQFDILFSNSYDAINFGRRKNVQFEILRNGWEC